MKALIDFFCRRHLLVNLITVLVFIGGIVAWKITNKEELPDITFNRIRISTSYSGASAADVEFYVTKPIEEAIQGIDGVYKVTSSSAPGNSSITVELARKVTDIDSVVAEIQSQVSSVSLPDDIINDPRVRVFETSKKAIIDIAIYDNNKPILDVPSRLNLQHLARGLESKLLAQPEVFEVNRSGYLVEEININVDPKKFAFYEIPLTDIAQSIQNNHVREPSGTLKSGKNEQVTVLSELNSEDTLSQVVLQGGFDSKSVRLSNVANIKDGFEEQTTITKVNGREAIMFNIVKNSSYGILETLDKVREVTDKFEHTVLADSSVKITYLDDESIDVRNRLSIITSNGLLGFGLILITLFTFLNKRSGFWVAMGLPFSLCFTLICGYFLGYTINGITLAGIIIVLGIVVDDAIVIAENISSYEEDIYKNKKETSTHTAAVEGTNEVISPVLASVLTTCVAFVPLFFFAGRFGNFVKFIPPIIFLMLFASIIESFFLLPSHMTLFPRSKKEKPPTKAWFQTWVNRYEKVLNILLPKRYWILLLFCGLMAGSLFIAKAHFKFVMFPDEESREIVLSGVATNAYSMTETSHTIQALEEFLTHYVGQEGIGVRTSIGQGRRGDAAETNQFSITLELTPSDKRKKSTDQLIKEIETFVETQKEISKVRFRKNRFGQSSGSVFEIVIQENDDAKRDQLVKTVMKELQQHPSLANIEEDVIPSKKEYRITYDQEKLKKLSINPSTISSTLRAVLNGRRLYTLFRNDEEIEVTLTVDDAYRTDINAVLSVPIANNQNYLVPLKDVVNVIEINAKSSIRRQDLKRTSFIYADLAPDTEQSPLEVADELEQDILPKLLAKFPSSHIKFEGEVIDTRESKKDLMVSIYAVVFLIYIVLALLFDSLIKPLRIMLVIPFGIIGVIIAFYLHGKTQFGFYAAIGTLGMLGVVVNDAIVMLSKLDSSENEIKDAESEITYTANIAKTRLRAIILTTLTTVVGVMPTAYGIGGKDTMLSDMMIALSWGLLAGTTVTLVLTPCFYLFERDLKKNISKLIKPLLPLLVLGVLCVPQQLHAQDKALSLNEFIQLATQNDLTFHTLLMDNLKFKYQHDLNVDVSTYVVEFLSGFDANTSGFQGDGSLNLSRTFPEKGQRLSATYDYSPSHSDDHSISFDFSQDIAQNAFGKSVKLDGMIQDTKTSLARVQLVEAYEDYLAELITLYYTWIRQYESVQLSKSSFKENEKVLQSILNRQKQKIADDTDVNKLQLQMTAKEEQVIRYEKNYSNTTRHIQRVTKTTNNYTLRPDTNIILDTLPKEKEVQQFKDQSRTFQALHLIDSQSQLVLDKAALDLLPSMELSFSLTQESNTTGYLGVDIALPITNRKSKAAYETSKINRNQTAINTTSTIDTLLTDVSNLYVELVTQKKLVDTATKKRILTSKILEKESENYSYGKINLNDYIQAVNQFDSARFDEIDQEITFQQLSVEWKRITDKLVEKIPTKNF